MIDAGVQSQNSIGVHIGTVGIFLRICIRIWCLVSIAGVSVQNVGVSATPKSSQ